MPRITGSWELRYIMRSTDIEALEAVHQEIGRRVEFLKRLAKSKALHDGDHVVFSRNGHEVTGTIYRLHLNEAWVKGDDGTIYVAKPESLVPTKKGSDCCPPDIAPAIPWSVGSAK